MAQFTRQDILLAISRYQAAVMQAANWLRQKDFSNIVLVLEPSGYIDYEKRIRYTFHGYGCLVTMDAVSIDFNLGFGGRIDGFDLWFMYDFYEQSVLNQGISYQEMQKLVDDLLSEGLIIKPLFDLEDGTASSDGLCYLATDWQNPNPPKFNLVCKQIEDLAVDPDMSG
jgi:hypothetical protein